MPVLAYHTVDPRPSILSVSPQIFAWQMGWLHERGFQVLSLGELVQRLRQGKSLPARSAAITFDDGFAGVHRHAVPVLQSYGYLATIFIVAEYCGKDNGWPGQPAGIPRMPLAGWEALGAMERAGMEIGSHTLSHPRLDSLAPREAEKEILGSKQIIEERLCHAVDLLAYPYGHYNQAILSLVKPAYTGAVTTRLEMARSGGDPYQIGRVDTFYLRSRFLFGLLATSGAANIYLRLRQLLHHSASRLLKRAWA